MLVDQVRVCGEILYFFEIVLFPLFFCIPFFFFFNSILEAEEMCTENGENVKKAKKKKSFFRSTNSDHLPLCGLGD